MPATTVLAIAEVVAFDDCPAWLEAAFAELHAALDAAGVRGHGPDGALYAEAFFQEEAGEVTAFVPIDHADVAGLTLPGRTTLAELPAGDVAVLPHEGSFDELDQTYGGSAPGSRRRPSAPPARSARHYPDDDHAEVCWPVTSRASSV